VTTVSLGLGGRLREARESAGLSQAALGRRLATSQAAVCNWETGAREPGLDTLDAIAVATGTPLAYLLGVGGEYRDGFRDGWEACAKAVTDATVRGAR
jgi:transcriptional regulator with XRE-family HTH domain